MWLSRNRRVRESEVALAGVATLEGDLVGVYLDGERREVPVYGPGGYCWRPMLGQELLVVKGADGPYVAAARCGAGVAPGEILLTAGQGGGSIRLCNDGSIELVGQVRVNGTPIEELGGGGSGANA